MLKEWIKQNFVLAVGISLPLLLIVVFMASVSLPRLLATPPQYKLVFAVNRYNYTATGGNYTADYVVEDGTLKLKIAPMKDGKNYYMPVLMIYDGKTDETQKINVSLPAEATGAGKTVVEATKNMKLDKNFVSPDGYTAGGDDGWYSGGLVTEIYGGHRYNYNNAPRVRKGAATFRVPMPDRNSYSYYSSDQFNFIGWVVEEKK